MKIVVLSPPFYSHFQPLSALAVALRDTGAVTYLGCSRAFEGEVANLGLRFCEININRNANTGQASSTRQAERERRRLQEFLDATRAGPVATLRAQNRHRLDDMLANPEELIDRIRELNRELEPDLWIVDQLSYGVTLALLAHGLRFVTFCPPHPLSVPPRNVVYSVPPQWPSVVSVASDELITLQAEALALEREFTARFNMLLEPFGRRVENAFRAASAELVVHNYPELPEYRDLGSGGPSAGASAGARRLFCGYCFKPPSSAAVGAWGDAGPAGGKAAVGAWGDAAVERSVPPRRIVVALGTFLAARDDVLITLGESLRALYPEATLAIGAGEHAEALRERIAPPTIIEPFLPQRELLREAELFVHHGGVSSLTEALYYGVPMIVMPFSSDQFNVAADLERHGFGAVLNPNAVSEAGVRDAVTLARSSSAVAALGELSRQVRERGPAYAAEAVLQLLRL